MLTGTLSKAPAVKRAVQVDWSSYLSTTGDAISGSPTWIVPSGITVEGTPSFASNVATAIVSGGEEGENYLITCRVNLASGASEDGNVLLKVRTLQDDPRLPE